MHIKIVLDIAETSHMMIIMDLRHVSSDDGVFKPRAYSAMSGTALWPVLAIPVPTLAWD
jgi:hypothetical protein